MSEQQPATTKKDDRPIISDSAGLGISVLLIVCVILYAYRHDYLIEIENSCKMSPKQPSPIMVLDLTYTLKYCRLHDEDELKQLAADLTLMFPHIKSNHVLSDPYNNTIIGILRQIVERGQCSEYQALYTLRNRYLMRYGERLFYCMQSLVQQLPTPSPSDELAYNWKYCTRYPITQCPGADPPGEIWMETILELRKDLQDDTLQQQVDEVSQIIGNTDITEKPWSGDKVLNVGVV